MEQKLYLDGHWLEAEPGKTFEVRNPATREIVGMVANGSTHEIPFGGFKQSGLGRECGQEGLEEYLELKSLVVNLSG